MKQPVSEKHRVTGTEDIQDAEKIRQPYGICVQMPSACTQPDAVVQHNSFIDKHRAGKQDQQIQDSPVPVHECNSGLLLSMELW